MVKKLFTALYIAYIVALPFLQPTQVEAATISGDFGTNLSAHWTFDSDGSDETGNNDLTENGTISYTTGARNNAADLRSTNNYFSITDAAQTGLDLDGDFSISFWMDPVSDTNTYEQIFVKDANGANNTRSYGLVYDDRNFGGYPRFTLQLFPTGYSYPGYWNGYYSYTLSTAGAFTHVVITCDISAANASKCYLYIDGSGQGYFTLGDGTGATSIQDSASAFQIGYSTFNQEFAGYIDEMTVWKGRILTSGEVTTLYNGGTPLDYAGGAPSATHTTGVSGIEFY